MKLISSLFLSVPVAVVDRKKVAIRGDRVLHGTSSNKLMMKAADAAAAATEAPAAAAAHAASVAAVDGPELSTSPAPGASHGTVGGGVHAGGFASTDQIRVSGVVARRKRRHYEGRGQERRGSARERVGLTHAESGTKRTSNLVLRLKQRLSFIRVEA